MAATALILEQSRAAGRARAGTAEIRLCKPSDISQVARLFHRAFRPQATEGSAALERYLHALFLEHPWQDDEIASRVFVSPQGLVEGFIGVLPLRMSLRGRVVKAAVASSLMVADPEGNPLAGARLLRSFLSGPQELSLSETSNPVAQAMWRRLGGEAISAYSLEWLRVLRPARFAVSVMGDAFAPLKMLHPFGAGIDALLDGLSRNPLTVEPIQIKPDDDVDPGDAEIVESILALSRHYALRPEWDADSLRQFLMHAATKRRHGVLVRRLVTGKGNVPIGCFLYYQRSGGVGYVLQVFARPDAREIVIDRLLDHAYRHQCIALRGRSTADLQDTLMRRQALFVHRSSLTVHSKDADLLKALRTDDALITGLAGESWTRLIGDTFE